jgi:hypothetical protein
VRFASATALKQGGHFHVRLKGIPWHSRNCGRISRCPHPGFSVPPPRVPGVPTQGSQCPYLRNSFFLSMFGMGSRIMVWRIQKRPEMNMKGKVKRTICREEEEEKEEGEEDGRKRGSSDGCEWAGDVLRALRSTKGVSSSHTQFTQIITIHTNPRPAHLDDEALPDALPLDVFRLDGHAVRLQVPQ